MNKLNLTVKLIGENGNIFNLLSIVRNAMRENGYGDQIEEFTKQAISSRSYDDALCVILGWVDVI